MINKFSYRPLIAYFLAACVFQIFLLQSLHQYFAHHHEVGNCSISDLHLHDDGHHHHTCDICLFRLAPTEVETNGGDIEQPEIVFSAPEILVDVRSDINKMQRYYLRGPPVTTV